MMLSVKKAVMLLIVAVYSVVRGRAKLRPTNPKRLAVIQMAKLGDMVCTTPVFRAIKENIPDARLYVVGNSVNKRLLANNADIDHYITFDGLFSMVRKLRSEAIDAAFIAGAPDFFSTAAAFLADIPLVVSPEIRGGYTPFYDLWYRAIVRFVASAPHRMGMYASREYLRLLEPVGIFSEDTTKHLSFSEAAIKKAEEILSGAEHRKPRVGIASSAGNRIKQWPAKNLAAVADYLVENYGAQIYIMGGPDERSDSDLMISNIKGIAHTADLTGRLSIDELKAVISLFDLFVGVDTGPIYIAEAFGVPTVDIMGAASEDDVGPRGPQHIMVLPPGPRKAELRAMNPNLHDLKEVRRQIESTSVVAVCEACDRLLAMRVS